MIQIDPNLLGLIVKVVTAAEAVFSLQPYIKMSASSEAVRLLEYCLSAV